MLDQGETKNFEISREIRQGETGTSRRRSTLQWEQENQYHRVCRRYGSAVHDGGRTVVYADWNCQKTNEKMEWK